MSLSLICAAILLGTPQASPWEREVVYQIFPRSFRDSNGDRIGDLKGIDQELGFLHRLGITAILINPIFASRVYHNYFADDFFHVDPAFGTNDDFFRLVHDAHRLKMKVILDMEVQYVADRHPWMTAPAGTRFDKYLWREGSAFYGINIHWFGGAKVEVAAVNPFHHDVKSTIDEVFRFWSRGVDGFRIDHMMDDLDNKNVMTGMLENFWSPLEQFVRTLQPKEFFIGEQADWQYGADLFAKGGVDAVYAFPLRAAFLTLDKPKIEAAIRQSLKTVPDGKTEFVFIENHDVERYSSAVGSNPALLRLGAVFNLTMKGTPMIYYGQELGMKGVQGNWNSDGNDIPVRLAYRWTRRVSDPGTADFYRGTGPWAKTGYSTDNDGISVEEESPKPDSLFNFYRQMIALRQRNPALREGSMNLLSTPNSNVLAYERKLGSQTVTIYLNLSSRPQELGQLSLAPYGYRILGAS